MQETGTKRSSHRLRHGHYIGDKRSPTYNSWRSIYDRCIDPSSGAWFLYGGRGITVCERWRDFANFLEDMGERPEGKTLDRIDPNGPYCKDNCRWASWTKQSRNRRNVKLTWPEVVEIKRRLAEGETGASLAKKFSVTESVVSQIKTGKTWRDEQ